MSIYPSIACRRQKVSMRYHFSKDASQTPDVDGCGVVLAPQQDFRRPVPKSDHLENITHRVLHQNATTNSTTKENNHVETDPWMLTLGASKVSVWEWLINIVKQTTVHSHTASWCAGRASDNIHRVIAKIWNCSNSVGGNCHIKQVCIHVLCMCHITCYSSMMMKTL